MPLESVNGVRLYCDLSGAQGPALVLVHGSWDSHHDWDDLVPWLAPSFRVLRYDRRGHSQSERPAEQGSVREDADDLAALLEHFGMAPAWVVANSFGASISLRLAALRPDLFSGLIAHEPPLFSLLADDVAIAPLLAEVQAALRAVADRIASGDHAGATQQFVETVALGPGLWPRLSPDIQESMIGNAPTFLDEAGDPEQVFFDLDWIRGFTPPVLMTIGDRSPPYFAPVARRIAAALPNAKLATVTGAGHVPHATHPENYAALIASFIRDAKRP